MAMSTRRVTSFSAAAQAAQTQWRNAQVELHGEFPVDHVKRFAQYASQTSWLRAVVVCLWTPVPIVVILVLVELIRLEDPRTHGIRQSPHLWLRCFLLLFFAAFCYLEQFRQHVPSLDLSRRRALPVALAGATVATTVLCLLCDAIAYPFPFSTNAAASACAVTIIGILRFAIKDQLRENPQLGKDLRRHLVVCACQIMMIAVYPMYNSLFVRASSWGQTAMVLILPLIKLACQNCISRWIANADEARAESVIFNVEVFHALYVSFSMQSSNANHTILAIMVVDFVQAWLSFRDIIEIVESIQKLTERLPEHHTSFLSRVCCILEANDASSATTPEPIQAKSGEKASAIVSKPSTVEMLGSRGRIHPTLRGDPEPRSEQLDTRCPTPTLTLLAPEKRAQLVKHTQKLLFVTEFVALIEYTEVLMPCIFNMCILVMYSLTNKLYYAFLRQLTPQELHHQVFNVFLYASLELLSLVAMGLVLSRKLGLSLLHQIAFVLETRQASVQSKVVMWALNVLHNQVDHAGVDYSFQFAWLKAKKTSST